MDLFHNMWTNIHLERTLDFRYPLYGTPIQKVHAHNFSIFCTFFTLDMIKTQAHILILKDLVSVLRAEIGWTYQV